MEHRALHYDAAGASAAMRTAGLHYGYAAALESGLWPSLDVLPAAERAATGVALTERALAFQTGGLQNSSATMR